MVIKVPRPRVRNSGAIRDNQNPFGANLLSEFIGRERLAKTRLRIPKKVAVWELRAVLLIVVSHIDSFDLFSTQDNLRVLRSRWSLIKEATATMNTVINDLLYRRQINLEPF